MNNLYSRIIILTFIIIVFLIFGYIAFHKRKCPICGEYMLRHFKKNESIPDYYFCIKCNTKKDVKIYTDRSPG